MSALRRIAAGLALACLAILAAPGWDTKENHANQWMSVYGCAEGRARLPINDPCEANEHEWLAEQALSRLLASNHWRISNPTDLYVVDLNASLFIQDRVSETGRTLEAEAGRTQRASPHSRPIEERDLVNPAHWAGLPDWSYSVYDWINKNQLCPSRPQGNATNNYCHVFPAWHGAGFNSSHFGTQARENYQSLHGTALSIARRARTMREQAGTGADLDAHREAIREAELMALIYEGAAQHFLQDRWAIGHMWERWNGPDYWNNAYPDQLGEAIVVGLFSGIIHGSESVHTIPLPMSSPAIKLGFTGRYAEPMEYEYASGVSREDAVGDYRARDMFDGDWGGYEIDVSSQRQRFLECSAGGFREVIEAFGTGPDGGYGVDGARLTGFAARGIHPGCFDMWATNWSIRQAWAPVETVEWVGLATGRDIRTLLPYLARAVVWYKSDIGQVDLLEATVESPSMVRISSRIYWNGLFRPNGTELARGGMGDYGRARVGTYYPAAQYLEPRDITALASTPRDPQGRDAETVFGFFNRANADYFCNRAETYLEDWRDVADRSDAERGACRVIAQRLYDSVDTSYPEDQRAWQSVDFAEDQRRARPLCAIAPGATWPPASSGRDATPASLHPGYVRYDFSANRRVRFEADNWQYSAEPVAHWCDRVPVIDLAGAPDEADLAVTVERPQDEITVTGLNFGTSAGHLRLGQNPDNAVEISDVRRWEEDEIRFSIRDELDRLEFNDDNEIFLFIERRPLGADDTGVSSVGRFILRREFEPPRVSRVEIAGSGETFYAWQAPSEPEEAQGDDVDPLDIYEETGSDGDQADASLPFKPVPPDTQLTIEIAFSSEMEAGGEGETFTLAGRDIEGRWINDTTWRGTLDIPGREAGYSNWRGPAELAIQARSREGLLSDAVTSTAAPDANRDHVFLIDLVPVFLQEIEVRTRGQRVYAARWQGGPDYGSAENLTREGLGNPERGLEVRTARAAPDEAEGSIRLVFSGPLETPPVVLLGDTPAEMEGQDERWQGTFRFQDAQPDGNGDIRIEITAPDIDGRNLDADPRTAAVIAPIDAWSGGRYWQGYEDRRGGATSANGGPDLWHKIGEPPDLSLIVILDASGSMDEQNRMDNARDGIRSTFANLPEDRTIEMAGVVFYNCGSFDTRAFTRDLGSIREFLLSANPSGGTPLAAAHERARAMLGSQADPRSLRWEFATFTDGLETCDGDVAGAARRLQSLIGAHQAPEEVGEAPPEPEPPTPPVDCRPDSWRGYQVRTEPDIALIEHSYLERALPGGRCIARHEETLRYVYYGAARDDGVTRSGWGINSNVSEREVTLGTSAQGQASIDRARNGAQAERRGLVSLEEARRQIGEAVARELGDSP